MTYDQRFRLSLSRALLKDPSIILIENLQSPEDDNTEIVSFRTIFHHNYNLVNDLITDDKTKWIYLFYCIFFS